MTPDQGQLVCVVTKRPFEGLTRPLVHGSLIK